MSIIVYIQNITSESKFIKARISMLESIGQGPLYEVRIGLSTGAGCIKGVSLKGG